MKRFLERFRSFRWQNFLGFLCTAMLYPVFALVSSGGTLLKFIDALTVVGLVMLVVGVLWSLAFHGDFDIAEYVSRRTFSSLKHEKIKSFAAFREDKKEKRKDSVNYPFLTGVLMLAASGLLILFVY